MPENPTPGGRGGAATPVDAFVGLGSNLERPEMQVRTALEALSTIPETRCVAHSALYLSPPMGPRDQPDFVNAVAELLTGLSAEQLLAELLAIEDRHGRVRGERWGPRILDLDLLLYGDTVMDTPGLVLPHPGVHDRSFVLVPLAELAPELIVPGHGPVQALVEKCPHAEVRRL